MPDRPEEVFVGIDVCKARLDVAMLPSGEVLNVPNTPQGIAELIAQLSERTPSLIVLEATGGLEAPAALALQDAGFALSVLNPRQVRDFARATGKLAKTDALDAALLARFAQAVRPAPRALPDSQTRALEALLTRRRQLVALLVSERNRLKLCRDEAIRADITALIDFLQQRKTQLDQDLQFQVQACPVGRETYARLTAVPGVGPVLALTLLAHLPELGQVSGKQLAALVGLAPLNRDSGKRFGKRRVWGGRAEVRAVLYMATVQAKRCNPAIKDFYERLLRHGKPKQLALIACMRKWLVMLNAMQRDRQDWQPPLAIPPESLSDSVTPVPSATTGPSTQAA